MTTARNAASAIEHEVLKRLYGTYNFTSYGWDFKRRLGIADIATTIIERHMGEISDLKERAGALYEALKLSIKDEDMWACKYCGEVIHCQSGHADKGCIWSCERCGDTFCAQCAKERDPQYEDRDDVTCPDCLSEKATS